MSFCVFLVQPVSSLVLFFLPAKQTLEEPSSIFLFFILLFVIFRCFVTELIPHHAHDLQHIAHTAKMIGKSVRLDLAIVPVIADLKIDRLFAFAGKQNLVFFIVSTLRTYFLPR